MGVIAALFAACGAEEALVLPEASWSSEDYEFATDYPENPLCAGTLKFQQGFVDAAQEIFGQPVGGERFTYYLFTQRLFDELLDGLNGAYWDPLESTCRHASLSIL